jgi:hypothetical protein
MKRALQGVVVVVVVAVALFFFWPRNTARAIIEQAIEAHGGEANITRCNVGYLAAQSSIHELAYGELTARVEEFFQVPGRYKRVIRQQSPGGEFVRMFMVKDGRYYVRENGGDVWETTADDQLDHFAGILTMLVRLKNENANLVPLAEKKVNGRPVVGVRLQAGDRSFGELLFDAETRLLAVYRREGPDPLRLIKDSPVDLETTYEAYRDFSGVQFPTRVITYRKGKKCIDMRITNVTFVDRLDDQVFSLDVPAKGGQKSD